MWIWPTLMYNSSSGHAREVTPQIGDRLVYVTEHRDYYGHALIDSRSAKEGCLSVCEQPHVPFV